MQHILLGLYPWELQLPWRPLTLKYGAGARLERVGRGRGPACARGVIVNICRRVGTSATVTTQTVSGKSVVGRRRDARPRIARMARLDLAMPRRNGSRRRRAKAAPKVVDGTEVTPVRGHAAETFFPLPYAIGQGATKPPQARLATRHATALVPAVRPFRTCRTENANGSLAVRWMGVRNGP